MKKNLNNFLNCKVVCFIWDIVVRLWCPLSLLFLCVYVCFAILARPLSCYVAGDERGRKTRWGNHYYKVGEGKGGEGDTVYTDTDRGFFIAVYRPPRWQKK